MKTTRMDDGSLELRESWPLLRAACIGGGVAFLALALYARHFDGILKGRLLESTLGVLALVALGGVVDDRWFQFDRRSRSVIWSRRNWFRSRSDRLAFSEIRDVRVVCTRTTRDSAPTEVLDYLAVLITADRRIPLTSQHSNNAVAFDALVGAVRDCVDPLGRAD